MSSFTLFRQLSRARFAFLFLTGMLLVSPFVSAAVPVAQPDAYTAEFETQLIMDAATGVLSNDTDADAGDVLTATLDTDVSNGVLTLNADGSFDYTPTDGFSETDSFTYFASDGQDNSAPVQVSISVAEPNSDTDLLVNLSLDDDQTPTVATDSSVYGNNGVITGATYGADSGDGSAASLEFTGAGTVNLGPVDVNGTGVTLAAWVKADSFPGKNFDPRIISKASGVVTNKHVFMLGTTKRGSSNEVVLRGRLRIGGVTSTFRANTGVMSPGVWYHTAMVYDESTLKLYLNGVEVASTSDINGPVDQDSSVDVAVGSQPNGGYHWDGRIDDVRIAQRPFSAAEIQALAVPGSGGSNSAPVAVADAYTASFETQLIVEAATGVLSNDTDADAGDVLTATLDTDVSSGTLVLSGDGSFTYTPDGGFSGTDSFTYFTNDGTDNSAVETVTLTVNGAGNAIPVAVADAYTASFETQLIVDAATGVLSNDTDADAGDVLTATLDTDVSNGVLTLNADGSFDYTPTDGFSETDSFTYFASDGQDNSAPVQVSISVAEPNSDTDLLVNLSLDDDQTPTVATDSSLYGNNGVITGATYGSDSGDGSAASLEFTGAGTVNLGPVDVNGTGVTLAAWVKADSFPGKNFDPRIISKASGVVTNKHVFMLGTTKRGSSNEVVLRGRVRIGGVTSTFRANTGVMSPGVWYHTAMVYDESTLKLYLNGVEVASTSDINGPVDQDSSVDVAVGSQPNGGYHWDGRIDDVRIAQRPFSAAEIQALAVPGSGGSNSAPVAVADAYTASFETQLIVEAATGVLSNDTDADAGDVLTATLDTDVSSGTLVLSGDGSFTYTPDGGFSGTDSFTYFTNDGTDNSAVETVTLTVNGAANAIPVAVADAYTASFETQLIVDAATGVLSNDTDADAGDVLTATLDTDVSSGTLTLSGDGSFTYTPDGGFSGIDSFTYFANDGTDNSAVETVTLTVNGAANAIPVAVADAYTASFETQLIVDAATGVLSNDTDADAGDVLTATLDTDVSSGTLALSGDGSFTYTPDGGFSGTDSFTYFTNDGTDNSAVATVTLTVASPDSTNIDVWYGANQQIGIVGHPQIWANVVGNVSDPDGIATLSYSLNGGASQSLSMGPDNRRLVAEGDFNIDMDRSLLNPGLNQVEITAIDTLGNPTSTTVAINYGDGTVWPDSYQIDWSQVATVQDAVEVYDGHWYLTPDGIRTVETGYDRLFGIGEMNWDQYELVSDFILHDYDVGKFAGLGLFGPWTGHTDDPLPGRQPKAGFLPFGAQTWTAFFPTGLPSRIQSGGYQIPSAKKNFTYVLGQKYNIRYRVERVNQSSMLYSARVWADGTVEPSAWDVQYTDITSGLSGGSLTFVAHFADVTFGDISVEPVFSPPPVAIADAFTTNFKTTLMVDAASGVLANDTGGNDTLTAMLVSDVRDGALTLNADGSFEYTPSIGFIGFDSFSYYATDGIEDSTPVLVNLSIADPNTDNDLLVHLTLDDDQSAAVAIDSSLYGNNGVITGATYGPDSGDGSSASLEFTDTDTVNLGPVDVNGTGVTLAAWVKADSFPGNNFDPRIISKASGVVANKHVFMLSTAKRGSSNDVVLRARVRVGGVTTTFRANSGLMSPGVWHHTAMVYDESTLKLYLDGVEVASSALSGPVDQDSSIDVGVGSQPNGGYHWDGRIDDVLIAQRPYSAAEIQALAVPGGGGSNSAPLVVADAYSGLSDEPLTVLEAAGVLSNDSDVDGDVLSATLDMDVSNGTLVLNVDGSFTYTPDAGFIGTDSFTYFANDGTENSAVVTVTLTVGGAGNTPTVAVADAYTTDFETQLVVDAANGVLFNDTDIDVGDVLTAILDTDVSDGTLLLNSDGSFNYTPDGGFSGTDSFTYFANDGIDNSAVVTVVLTIGGADNTPPVAVADAYTTAVDTASSVDAASGVLSNDTDADAGDVLTAILDTDVSSGTLALSSEGSFTYSPDGGFSGTDSFTYFANDGTENSAIVTVTLTVGGAVNTPPVAVVDAYTTDFETQLVVDAASGVLFNDTDVDAEDVLTATLDTDVSNGVLILNADGSFDYTPATGFFGIDSFTYFASDDQDNSAPVQVSISVAEPNSDTDLLVNLSLDDDQTPTVATDSSLYGNNGIITGATYGSDSGDGSAASLEFTGAGTVNLGPVDVNGTGVTLAAWVKADSFPGKNFDPRIISKASGVVTNKHVFMLSTTKRGSSNEVVLRGRVRIGGVTTNYRSNTGVMSPGVWYHTAMVYDESTLKLYLDGVEIASAVVSGPVDQDSSMHVAVGSQPNGGFHWDGRIDDVLIAQRPFSAAEIQALAVPGGGGSNSAPLVVADAYSGLSDEPLTVLEAAGVLSNDSDVDGDVLSATLDTDVSNGTLVLNVDGSFMYTPDAGFIGTDSFTYFANDGTENSAVVTVTLTVGGAGNTPPVAVADTYTTDIETQLVVDEASGVLSNDTDSDLGDTITAELDSNVANGTLTLNSNGSFSYTPDNNFTGADSFSYHATDGLADSATVQVSILVSEQSIDTDMLAHLEFEDFETPVFAEDSSTNGNFGIISGAQYIAETSDGSAYSLDFDGGDTIDLGEFDVAGTGLTLAAWVNADTFPGAVRDSRIISKASGTADNDHIFMLSTIKSGTQTLLRAGVQVGGNTTTLIADSGTSLSTGVWYHVAVTYDGVALTLYLDGIDVGSVPLSGPVQQNSTVSVAVGSQPGGGSHFDGKIDDVRILQRGLTQAEIALLVNSAPAALPTPENLTALALTDSHVDLAWSSVPGAVEYRVYRNGVLIATITDPSYRDTTVAPGVNYSYEIIAVNASGGISEAAQDSATVYDSLVGNWWGGAWNYRTRVAVDSNNTARENSVATIPMDFDALIVQAGGVGSHDPSRVRCVEIASSGELLDADIRCQSGDGQLILMLSGNTPTATTRYFHVYFDDATGGEDDTRPPLVSLTENVIDEGYDSMEITTNTGSLNYHTGGAGISSLLDSNGIDWISYNSAKGGNGKFRGIPNLVPPVAGGFFHPGPITAATTLIDSGPLRVRFESVTVGGDWRIVWDVYPDYLSFTLLDKPADNYWFLYEGTPGGLLDTGDSTVRSTGSASILNGLDSWNGDIPGEEWVMVNASEVPRSLFVAKEKDDDAYDSYRPLSASGQMTVLGIGRRGNVAEMTATDETFFVGFLETQDFLTARARIRSIIQALDVGYSSAVDRP